MMEVEQSETPIDADEHSKYTPLECQVLDFKRQYPDTILLIECGHTFRAFGEDAQVVSKALYLKIFTTHNFASISFPVHRLPVHVRRLVIKGHKVGVIKQSESTALKAIGENRNKLFTRKLDALYTPSTYIDEVLGTIDDTLEIPSISGCLMCISEMPSKNDSTIQMGIVTVNVRSGDVFYFAVEGTHSQSYLEDCFSVSSPVEFLLPVSLLGEATENLIRNYIDIKDIAKVKVRVERVADDEFEFTNVIQRVSSFFASEDCSEGAQVILKMNPAVLCCLSPLISYLSAFNLESLLRDYRLMKPMHSSLYHMSFNASAIRCLELVANSTDHQEYGSLLWTINKTCTKFGKKLLRSWLLKPCKKMCDITERLDMVDSVLYSDTPLWAVVEKMLSKLPDVEKLLCNSLHRRISVSDFVVLVTAFVKVQRCFTTIFERIDVEIENLNLKNVLTHTISILENIEYFARSITDDAAREKDKNNIFHDLSKYPDILECKIQLDDAKQKLMEEQGNIASVLQMRTFNYTTVLGQNYLIEVQHKNVELVPDSWLKISATKQVSRYQSPEVIVLTDELDRCSEKLSICCKEAWNDFLKEFAKHFYKYKMVVHNLAVLDCIISFSKIAKKTGFSRPVLSENQTDKVVIQGRNPIMCNFIKETGQYVANDLKIKGTENCMIITGPNMGGKSSYVRQIALIWILAQIGCYVPADFASLPLCDGIYVRMGSVDDLCARRSTFMTEMDETSAILNLATTKSLVILDELGQGTSSNDGAAIAFATLVHLVTEVQCTTLFVTHYPHIARDLEKMYPDRVTNVHLGYLAQEENIADPFSTDEVTFLYSVWPGVAPKSYGINVARLVGIPDEILIKAKQKSREVEMNARK